ncbi:hypothetical protein EU546_05325 [Candidatus Thorarchaeota archaeon]|nr:MAG: hypothetical protein EU546_05325 [Candidatus Thorarchaeota archaeon]
MNEDNVTTIFDRPRALRFIGLTQMLFGVLGFVGSIGLVYAWYAGVPDLVGVGPLYALAMLVGVAVPCLVIGNYVDDLRRNAVIAQIIYSAIAVALCIFFLVWRGIDYNWTVPFFDMTFDVYIGNLAAGIMVVEAVFVLYLILNWDAVVPPEGARVVRDKKRARVYEERVMPTPISPGLISRDGLTELTPDEERRILDVRRVTTEEGLAILCSNCGGATPVMEVDKDNTVECQYCGVTLGLSSVFVPCENHPNYLAATKCSVCGNFYCRKCLTAQEPPVDERWEGSTIFLCQKCFEGRYRPAVTTTSLVIPIDDLFEKAGGRFSRIGGIYKRFLGMYGRSMRWVVELAARMAAAIPKSGGGGGGGGDDAAAALLVFILIVIAIPVAIGVVLLLAGIVIIPILFYAGLVGVTIEAVRIIRRTDFVSLEQARDIGIVKHEKPKQKESPMREVTREWQNTSSGKQPAEAWLRRI